MQSPQGLLSVVTYPVGAGLGQRIVIDGPRGAVFEYDSGNNLVGSWASKAGTDPYGHTYPAGFQINGGTIIAGLFEGTNFVISSSGAFWFSGTPGFNNLIESISNTAFTDIFNNAILAGFTAYEPGSPYIATNIHNGMISWYTAPNGGGPWTLITRMKLNTTTNGVQFDQPILAPVIEAPDPSATGTPDPWHIVGNALQPAFQNSWANAGGANVVCQFKQLADSRMVMIVGRLTVPVAAPNTIIFTLPAAYRPLSTQSIALIITGQAGGTPQLLQTYASVGSTGDVTAHNIPAGLTSMTVEFAQTGFTTDT